LYDWLDRWLFIIIFLIGAIFIILLKHAGLKQWIVTMSPVVMMLIYTAYVSASSRYQLREDHAGDNLYYLGFLYTLTSLSYSLYEFSQEDQGTQRIISNFGIALATTIVGLALRVLFTQMREDPIEIERGARIELSQFVSNLKSEIDDTILAFNLFRRKTIQSIDEGFSEIREKVHETIIESNTCYSNMSKEIIYETEKLFRQIENIQVPHDLIERKIFSEIDEMLKRITDRIEGVIKKFSENFSQMNVNTGEIIDETENLLYRIRQIQVPPDLIEKQVYPEIDQLLIRTRNKVEDMIDKFVNNSYKMNVNTEEIVNETELLANRIRKIKAPPDLIEKQVYPEINNLLDHIKNFNDQVRDLVINMQGIVDMVQIPTESKPRNPSRFSRFPFRNLFHRG
jgi:methyl-accepting chemotaxis protein